MGTPGSPTMSCAPSQLGCPPATQITTTVVEPANVTLYVTILNYVYATVGQPGNATTTTTSVVVSTSVETVTFVSAILLTMFFTAVFFLAKQYVETRRGWDACCWGHRARHSSPLSSDLPITIDVRDVKP
jgi:hypothetical protein